MISSVSCTQFLEEDPKGRLAPDVFFNDRNDLDMALHALYYRVTKRAAINASLINFWAGDDIGTHPTSNKQWFREFDRYAVSANNEWLYEGWRDLWVIVKAANFIINNAGRSPLSEQEIKYGMAHAYYWRAYAYFMLVQCWGALPLMLKNEVDYTATLHPVEEIYDLIVSDLKSAEEAQTGYDEAPWAMNGINVAVNRAAVKATLAYVYLSMAGWPLNRPEYYAIAAEKAKEVIDGVKSGVYYYRLLDNYADVHSLAWNKRNPEVLLAVYYSRDYPIDGSGWADVLQDVGTNGWGDSCGEIKFWLDFPAGPRKEATYAPKTYRTTDGTLQDWWWDTNTPSRAVVNPWFIKQAAGDDGMEFDYRKGGNQGFYISVKDHHVIRLSEVYCWYAEALGRSGQTNAEAVELLNQVRRRADGKVNDLTYNYYAANLTPDALAEAAYNEHGWEIAGSYWGSLATRYFDMFRMNRVKDHFEFRKVNPLLEVAPGVWRKEAVTVNGTWTDDMMYAPYPASDALLNPNLKKTEVTE
jgi:hypothetical protein